MNRIAIAILAAGQGNRMGSEIKPLVQFGNETLLRRAVRTATESMVGDVFVVVGFMVDQITEHLNQTIGPTSERVTIIRNNDWNEGIASSLRAATHAAEPYDALIFMTVDQPFVGHATLQLIRDAFVETERDVIASVYGAPPLPGIPALFSRKMFPSLSKLQGDRGAKQLIMNSNPLLLEHPAAAYDIDTMADLQECLTLQGNNLRDTAFNHFEREPISG